MNFIVERSDGRTMKIEPDGMKILLTTIVPMYLSLLSSHIERGSRSVMKIIIIRMKLKKEKMSVNSVINVTIATIKYFNSLGFVSDMYIFGLLSSIIHNHPCNVRFFKITLYAS